MLIGPVFTREVVTTPRRPRLYIYRAVYAVALFVLMCTAWAILAGTQVVRNVGDMAQFGQTLFTILAPLQLLLTVFFAALTAAAAVCQEKDRKTLILLLITRLTNSELVLGKLMASLLNVLVMLATALPMFMLMSLFGGISFAQIGWVFAVTTLTALVAGSLGSTIALWREKTFQTLAMTAMILVPWLVVWPPLAAAGLDERQSWWATALTPLGAVWEAAQSSLGAEGLSTATFSPVVAFLIFAAGLILLFNGVAIARVRVWNPSREVRRGATREDTKESIWGVEHDLAKEEATGNGQASAEAARAGHVDSQLRSGKMKGSKTRNVWDNPILWREICTWAYGRKVIAIRVAYALIFAVTAVVVYFTFAGETSARHGDSIIPAGSMPLGALLFISLVIVSALAVTSITNERDGRALDLLLATDLTPKEFIFGKLGGVLWVAKEMIVLPLLLAGYVWWAGGISLENLVYLVLGLMVMYIFVAMLGVHCGMIYASSRTSIIVSLGTVFFLFLGVLTCVFMMVSFSGSFQVQLAPFIAFILGGGVGLYVSLGIRNPSAAIAAASLCVPFATFYAIVSFLREMPLAVFLVMSAAYGFTTAAMLIPAIYEFDVAMGRTTGNE